ncbi:DNA-directed RNA polymerase subunit K [Candidatus Micrarchaeota archaeon]|jgi:DNA-directed RNA polymerase subunit K|nr:DNA-directed RNA polymerase subunit K [Candidatus Micrarchaeota archaeon]
MYSKFERARLIGARALQIECGAPPLISVSPTMNPISVAEEEFGRGVLPLVVYK